MWSIPLDGVFQRGPMNPHLDQTSYVIISIGLLIIVGYLALTLFPRLEGVRSSGRFRPEVERLEEGRSDPSGGSVNRVIDVALRLLNPDERMVVEAVVRAGGTMLQKDISYELGFSRVKTHRTLVRLIERGVVTTEKEYNTNRIELADWLKEGQHPSR